ncbi:HIT domain-containing protein [Candidatus Woesearchaeota archaeon]|nr:HIT domain-containing protein [Candidatus Woesearchaeota archaeon]
MMNGCVFCDVAKNRIKTWTFYEDKLIKAFFDIHPANLGHSLIIPRKHYSSIVEVPDSVLLNMFSLAKKLILTYREVLSIKDFNILLSEGREAGQEIPHVHVHIIPRFAGDGVVFNWKEKNELTTQFPRLQKEIQEKLKSLILK